MKMIKPQQILADALNNLKDDDSGYIIVLHRKQYQFRHYLENLGKDINLDMVLIPSGTFLMGSPEGEPDRFDEESPRHEVTVPRFFLGRYTINQAQWKIVSNYPEIEIDLNPTPANFKGDQNPIKMISWDEANEFCQRLSAHTQRQYRLPSEAEWEYACRAGTTTPFHHGETISTELANYYGQDYPEYGWSGSYGKGVTGENRQKPTPVGSFPPNQFGLYDMHGNVWEWCLDDWHHNYENAPQNGEAWLSDHKTDDQRSPNKKVLRGGSWYNTPRFCRSANRYYFVRGDSYNFVGFRVVCEVPQA